MQQDNNQLQLTGIDRITINYEWHSYSVLAIIVSIISGITCLYVTDLKWSIRQEMNALIHWSCVPADYLSANAI